MSLDVGDPWTPRLTVLDADDEPTTATVAVVITAPDGTTDTPTVTTPSLGLYQATVLLTQAGKWTASWSTSGGVTGTEAQHVYVRTLGVNVVDLADVKQHLQMEDDTDDDELEFFVDAANEWIATQVSTTHLNSRPVQLATRELVRHWWDSQRGPAAGPLDGEDFSLGGLGFAIPTRVKELLGPYRLSQSATVLSSFPTTGTWPDDSSAIATAAWRAL